MLYVVNISLYGITGSSPVTWSSGESSGDKVPNVFGIPKAVIYAAALISLGSEAIVR